MSKISTITFPIDTEIKKKAEEKAEKAGFSFEYFIKFVVDKSLRDLIKQKTTGSEIRIRLEEPTEYLKNAIKQARKNRKEGKSSPVFDNAEDSIKWLENQGV